MSIKLLEPKETYQQLTHMYKYNDVTGVFTKRSNGKVVKSFDKRGYALIHLLGKRYYAHRMAWLYHYGELPKGVIDHIDHNRSNNSIDNLRDVSQKENRRNSKKSCKNKSGVTGVFWDAAKLRWKACIKVDNTQIHLGTFTKFSDAVNTRKIAEVAYGFHENHGN